MSFCSLTKRITPKIRMLCFVQVNTVLLNFLCLWTKTETKNSCGIQSVDRRCRSIHEQTTLTKRRTSANISLITRAKTGLVNECSHLRVWMQYGSRWFSLGSHATTWNGAVPKSIMAPTQGAKPVWRWQLPRPLAPLSCALFEGGNNLKASI